MKYTILKNWHYSFPLYPLLVSNNEIKRKVIIPKDAWFKKVNADDEDINKLFGVSFGLFGIHKNSFRVGWKPSIRKFEIELYVYYYNNENKHTSQYLTSIYTSYHYNIAIRWDSNNMFAVDIDGENYFMRRLAINKNCPMFFCRPYHGGNNKAKNKYSLAVMKGN